jgi:hypothetical protein
MMATTGSAKRLIPYYTVPLSTLPGNLRPLTQRWAGGWPGVGGLTSRCPEAEFAVQGCGGPPSQFRLAVIPVNSG